MKTYILLATGFEEVEALVPADLLKRAGADVVLVSVEEALSVEGSHGITVTADTLIEDININEETELLILPGGGKGTERLAENSRVKELTVAACESGAYIGAICAAPSILGRWGLLEGRKATCYPGFQDYLTGSTVVKKKVVCDDTFVTADGMGSSFEFGFTLVELLFGRETAEKLKATTQYTST